MAGVGLVEDLELVVHREATPTGFGHHFRIASHSQGRRGGLNQRRGAGNNFLLEETLFIKETFLPSTLN